MLNLFNSSKKEIGLVVDWEFHTKNKWVSAFGNYFANTFINEFEPYIIDSQKAYNKNKKNLKYILSFEPGWAAPKIKLDNDLDAVKLVMMSDPHLHSEERLQYFMDNDFSYVLSLYKSPFFYHLKNFPKDKFIHFPWAVPDQFINKNPIEVRGDEVAIFGGKGSDAYDVRNWCREQPGITSYEFSGTENKKLSDEEYYLWLRRFDAIVAAGSSNPIYDLVTPKYFEIASSGALLVGQYCSDLEVLGFNETNTLIFTKENFNEKIKKYKSNPREYIEIRKEGINLIEKRHKISDRINTIKTLFNKE